MKNQYFADINDYRKYGLLRALVAPASLTAGICWMLTPDDDRSDGQFTRYWQQPERWRRHDPDLYDALAGCSAEGVERNVSRAEEWELIPRARYAPALLSDSLRDRADYFTIALERLNGVDLLFFDPDNGLEVSSVARGRRGSSKYLYWSEVATAFQLNASILIYQHFPRRKRGSFRADMARKLREVTGAADVTTFSTAHVLFLLAIQPHHVSALEAGVALAERRWSGQIEIERHVA